MNLRYLRLFILCIIAGIIVGVIVIPFRWLLVELTNIRNEVFSHFVAWYWHLILIAGMWSIGMGLTWLVRKYPETAGSGIPEASEVITGRLQIIKPFRNLIAKFIGGIASIGMGLSLSRGGPSVEIGSFVGRIVGNISKTNSATQRYLQAASGAAGLSAAFTTPLSATLFLIEGMTRFDSVKMGLSALLATGVAGWAARYIFPNNEYLNLNVSIPQELQLWQILIALACFAIIISIIGKLFNNTLLALQQYYKRSKLPTALKVFAIVALTYMIGWFFPTLISDGEQFLLGQESTSIALWLLFLIIIMKLLFTAICYSAGFPGGIFLPLLVVGGLTGKLFGLVLVDLNIIDTHHFGFFIVLGMAALFATSVRTPITGIIFTIEITQQFEALFPTIIFVGATYFISQLVGVKPIYDSLYQRLIPQSSKDPNELICVDFTINYGSYMNGKQACDIQLPARCQIKRIMRNNAEIELNSTLEIDDIITISIPSTELETLYSTFRAMTNE